MSREIKFRAWNGREMVTTGIRVNGGVVDAGRPTINKRFESVWESMPIMQFTGLKDKNGVEIFEGDVVRWDDASRGKYWRVAEVVWHECGSWCYRTIPNQCVGAMVNRPHDFKLGSFIYTPDSTQYGNVLEVIGNIHESPELLTQEKIGE